MLRLRVTPYFGAGFLASILAGFCQTHPGPDLYLDLSPARFDLLRGGYDLAIRMGTPAEPDLFSRRLTLARLGLYAAHVCLARRGQPQSPAVLGHHDCLSLAQPTGGEIRVRHRTGGRRPLLSSAASRRTARR